ncbi:3-dehydroquinate dehydratase [Streptomyces sp. A0642]|nr:3-dehydroquinate dehydratase [Streptomyces sp. A0642]
MDLTRARAVGRVLVLNGPNLNLLGTREPALYGSDTLADVEKLCRDTAAANGLEAECRQSNHEGGLGRVSKVPPARRRLALPRALGFARAGETPLLAALSGSPRYSQYRGDPPPCDRTHQTPPSPPSGRTALLSKHALVDAIHEARTEFAGIVINPGAYSHTSVAIRDALAAVDRPVVEVHLTNIHRREEFRHHSYVSGVADVVICGAGTDGYVFALTRLARLTGGGAR